METRLEKLQRLNLLDELAFRKSNAVKAATKLHRNRAVDVVRANFLTSHPPGPIDGTRPSFLYFPGEIRNQVYDHVLDMKPSRTLVPRRDPNTKPCAFLGLLLACRQLSFELRTRIEAQLTAYIPIMGGMRFGALAHQILESGTADLCPVQATVLTALTSFMNVRFHFHNGTLPDITVDRSGTHIRYNQDGSHNVDECGSFLLWRFRHALLLFSSSSEMVVDRHGGDKQTAWDIRHYFFTGIDHGDMDVNHSGWNLILCQIYEGHQESCAALENVQIMVDVYGNGKWSYERRRDKGRITRGVVESSREWPSWPEVDVPWRGGVIDPGGWDRWKVRYLE
ncbi:hypothetical protein P154DRAFT_560312 [Amniculicola lignicola CBS 123094]|uniref:Uncharacterized protein n=1 Tax=Amniculicola lignicola CBS 123094 TaxID=1392246 RepID=A0A6A5WVA7_9PLEO|nr:hypothetical protein P154DRAFT_560312 [Amniculicola lignicola CBS 123094]